MLLPKWQVSEHNIHAGIGKREGRGVAVQQAHHGVDAGMLQVDRARGKLFGLTVNSDEGRTTAAAKRRLDERATLADHRIKHQLARKWPHELRKGESDRRVKRLVQHGFTRRELPSDWDLENHLEVVPRELQLEVEMVQVDRPATLKYTTNASHSWRHGVLAISSDIVA